MTLKTATYYSIECDESGCGTTTSDLSDYSAWADHGAALDDWVNSDGVQLKDGSHYCAEHRAGRVCVVCESEDDVVNTDDEDLCKTCRTDEP